MSEQGVMFSVVIPVYNRIDRLQGVLDSFANQTFQAFEIIIVDDGSKTAVANHLDALQSERIRVIHIENSERGAARNAGARVANGVYLNFFDSDDLAYSDHLEKAREVVDGDGPEVFSFGFDWLDANEKRFRSTVPKGDPFSILVNRNDFQCNTVFIRRDVWEAEPFNEDRALAASEDWELWLRLAARYRWRIYAHVTAGLVDHEGRSVRAMDIDAIEQRKLLMLEYVFQNELLSEKLAGQRTRMESRAWTYIALHAALGGQKKRARKGLGKAVGLSFSVLFTRRFYATLKHIIFG